MCVRDKPIFFGKPIVILSYRLRWKNYDSESKMDLDQSFSTKDVTRQNWIQIFRGIVNDRGNVR